MDLLLKMEEYESVEITSEITDCEIMDLLEADADCESCEAESEEDSDN